MPAEVRSPQWASLEKGFTGEGPTPSALKISISWNRKKSHPAPEPEPVTESGVCEENKRETQLITVAAKVRVGDYETYLQGEIGLSLSRENGRIV